MAKERTRANDESLLEHGFRTTSKARAGRASQIEDLRPLNAESVAPPLAEEYELEVYGMCKAVHE